MIHKNHFILFLILLLGTVIRVFQLGQIPAILNRDEAALAYNSYLLSETGKDEWGKHWPLTLESFGDYKLPGYPVLLIPFLAVFSWSDVAVKMPSVLAGLGLIWSVYLLGKRFRFSSTQRLLAALLIAIQPVFIFYSRIAFEANVALFFFTTALWLLLRPHEAKTTLWKTDLLGCALMLVAVLTYNTPLLLLPFIIGLLIFYRNIKQPQQWFLPATLLTLLTGGMLYALLSITQQKSSITIFSDETTWMNWIQYRSQLSGWLQPILGNRYLYDLGVVLKNFLNSFSFHFLVKSGGTHPWHSLPNRGHLLGLVYLMGLIGIFVLIGRIIRELRHQKKWSQWWQQVKSDLSLLYLLVIGLAPAAVTVDAPHATRSLFFFVCFSLVAVKGFSVGYEFIKARFHRPIVKQVVGSGILLLLILESASYLYQYFGQYPQQQPVSLQVGFDQAIQQAERAHPDQQIAVVDSEGYQYILAAWYLKIPAQQFFDTIVKQQPNLIGFRYGERVGNLHFISQPMDRTNEPVLVQYRNNTWQIEE